MTRRRSPDAIGVGAPPTAAAPSVIDVAPAAALAVAGKYELIVDEIVPAAPSLPGVAQSRACVFTVADAALLPGCASAVMVLTVAVSV